MRVSLMSLSVSKMSILTKEKIILNMFYLTIQIMHTYFLTCFKLLNRQMN